MTNTKSLLKGRTCPKSLQGNPWLLSLRAGLCKWAMDLICLKFLGQTCQEKRLTQGQTCLAARLDWELKLQCLYGSIQLEHMLVSW